MDISDKNHKSPAALRLLAAASAVAALLFIANAWVMLKISKTGKEMLALQESVGQSSAYAGQLRAVRDSRVMAVSEVKNSLTDIAKAKKMIYEAGLSLQEEKRLLEKQYELMTTYLELDEETGKIQLLRGDQAVKNFAFSAPLRALGGVKNAPPGLSRIISKERFAYIERGKAEKADGRLKWDPPQIGEKRSDSPLGEYVVFTDGPLILHAPVLNSVLHGSYPHLCAGLTLYSAKRLYESVFIGNKLLIKTSAVAKSPEPAKPARPRKKSSTAAKPGKKR